MANRRKAVLAAIALIASLATVYTAWAHIVALHVFKDHGALYWPTPGYSFLPLPSTPTGIVAQVIWPLSQSDIQYYQYLIQSGALIIITVLLWLGVFYSLRKFRKTTFKGTNPSNSPYRQTCDKLSKVCIAVTADRERWKRTQGLPPASNRVVSY